MFETLFVVLACLLSAALLVLAALDFKSHKKGTFSLGICLLAASAVNFSYIVSVVVETEQLMSIMSSLYFSFIDVMLLSFLYYLKGFCAYRDSKLLKVVCWVATAYAVFDVLVLLTNPIHGFAISYDFNPAATLSRWRYAPHLLYVMHLGYTYTLIAVCIITILAKAASVPSAYRARYFTIVVAILLIVAMNAIFLYVPQNTFSDFSIIFYLALCAFLYYNEFYYQERSMRNMAQQMILTNVIQPYVLFDNEERFYTCNKMARTLIDDENRDASYTLKKFLEDCGLAQFIPYESREKATQFEWRFIKHDRRYAYSCNYTPVKGEAGSALGYLFVFMDISFEMDMLTGFHTKDAFRRQFTDDPESVSYPACVTVCDLNKLSLINKSFGRPAGDQAIRMLSSSLRRHLPEDAYFARMDDAVLLAVCSNIEVAALRNLLVCVGNDLAECDLGIGPLGMQSSVCSVVSNTGGVLGAADRASASLKSLKMMDSESSHSSLMASFAQTLQESDGSTQAHVQRTRELGESLALRLGLSDYERTSLSLLCLLHDVGKLGIPLEVLNKPGKLTNEEWDLMRSHVEKGYRIALASDELKNIAPFILHHHEAWDGSGYPDGLRNEAIPLLSRIIAVVDTYDAMVNDRPYRSGMSTEDALEELKRCSGKQFDPFIVNEFIDMILQTTPGSEVASHLAEKASDASIPQPFLPMSLSTEEVGAEEEEKLGYIAFASYTLNNENSIVEINDEFTRLTGYTSEDLETYKLTQTDLILREDRARYNKLISEKLPDEHETYIEHRLVRKDGSVRSVLCYGRQYYDSVIKQYRSRIVCTDIMSTRGVRALLDAERESALRNVSRWELGARTDSMTGIFNHQTFKTEVQTLLNAEKGTVLYIMMDLDNFKRYNDTKGHPAGDELLKKFSHWLAASIPSGSIYGRMGGDEFAVAVQLRTGASESEAGITLGRIWSSLSELISREEEYLSISMGAALQGDNQLSFDKLYKAADAQLYRAKEEGRSRYCM